MPNQENYRTDLTKETDPRFTVSRIINVPDETILNEEVPASFAFDVDDNIEIHLYSSIGNQLIFSTNIRLEDDIIKSHIVSYRDGTFKNYIRIDFTKLFEDKSLAVVPGDYRMVLNFFSDEIGSYDNKKLNVDIITDSRTEVQLSFNDTFDAVSRQINSRLLEQFIQKRFNKTNAVGVAEKIFVSGVELKNSSEGLTAENVEQNITVAVNQTASKTLDKINTIGAKKGFDEKLNEFIPKLFEYISQQIVISESENIRETEFKNIIQRVVKEQINEFANSVDLRISVT